MRLRTLPIVSVLGVVAAVMAVAVGAAALAAGCGGSPEDGIVEMLSGSWQRVDGGEPNPDFTLHIAAARGGVEIVFTNVVNGRSTTVLGSVADGAVQATLPTADDIDAGASPAPAQSGVPAGAPTAVPITLGLSDTGGQLTVDVVLADGTLEPIWIYQRVTTP